MTPRCRSGWHYGWFPSGALAIWIGLALVVQGCAAPGAGGFPGSDPAHHHVQTPHLALRQARRAAAAHRAAAHRTPVERAHRVGPSGNQVLRVEFRHRSESRFRKTKSGGRGARWKALERSYGE